MDDVSSHRVTSRPPTKADSAYSELRRAIVTGEIAGGVPLDEVELAEMFGLGRTPTREALKRLAVERFVLWLPRRSPIVAEMSVQDVKRLFEARAAMEDCVCQISATRITDAQVDRLNELCDGLGAALRSGDSYGAVEIDFELHNLIAEGSQNKYLAHTIATLNSGALRLWFQTFEQIPEPEDAVVAHKQIVDALARRDPEAASEATRRQMSRALQRQMQLGTEASPQKIHLSDAG